MLESTQVAPISRIVCRYNTLMLSRIELLARQRFQFLKLTPTLTVSLAEIITDP